MKYIKLILTLVLFSVLITSCSKKSKLGKLIPKEAAVVVHLNTKSLLSKLSWDEIKQSYWYNEMMADSSVSATSKTFISDPAKTGIDINSDIVFFVLKPDNNGQAVVEGTIKESKAFADFLKGMHPTATVSKDGELNISKIDNAVVGWNNERFVFVSNADQHKFGGMDSLGLPDSTNITLPPPPPPVSTENLVSVCKNIFALKDDNSLYKNERFADLEEEEGDIHFWMNTGELYKGSMNNMPGMAAMVKLDKFLEDNVSTGTINFQDGKITATGKQYFGKELSDILKNDDVDIDADMIKRLPSQNVAGVIAFHFTPGNLLQIIKLTGLDGFINLFLGQKGLSLDDIMKATKGDILFAATDVTHKADSLITDSTNAGTITHERNGGPSASFLFSVSIGDKDAFNKILNLWNTTIGKEVSQKNIFQKTDDKYFAAGNSQDAVNKYFSGTQSNPDYLSKLNDHSMGGYIDVQMIMKALQPELTKDSVGKLYYDRNITMWNNAYFTGGDYKGGGLVSNGELNLMDKTTNSLKQLNQFINDMVKISKEHKKQKTDWRIDSTSSKTQTDTVLRKKR